MLLSKAAGTGAALLGGGQEGLHQIISIKSSINRGLSDMLKAAFPEIIPIDRPVVNEVKIKDPNGLAGFSCSPPPLQSRGGKLKDPLRLKLEKCLVAN